MEELLPVRSKDVFIPAVVVSLMALGAGCGLFLDQEVIFLQRAQDHATQREVRERLGPPLWTATPRPGETVFVYQITQREKGGNNIFDITGFWCDEYVLTFDQEGILRHWRHKSKKHRDPPTSANCVSNGFAPEGTVRVGTW
ncbi:hypothetical protein [Nitrospira sp. Nam74]